MGCGLVFHLVKVVDACWDSCVDPVVFTDVTYQVKILGTYKSVELIENPTLVIFVGQIDKFGQM